mmetsp:Transcript_43263/g.112386  ORF Transcript_43263/g.112386 Transcript_43263/m.112386 type:complete len:133 (+) Transcript_43263:87-485(+)
MSLPFFSSPPASSSSPSSVAAAKDQHHRRNLHHFVGIATEKGMDALLVPMQALSERLVAVQKGAIKYGEPLASIETRLKARCASLSEEKETLSFTHEALQDMHDSDAFDNMLALVESATSKLKHLRSLRDRE